MCERGKNYKQFLIAFVANISMYLEYLNNVNITCKYYPIKFPYDTRLTFYFTQTKLVWKRFDYIIQF